MCPICGSKMKENYNHNEYSPLYIEYEDGCPKCNFVEGEWCGHYYIGIGDSYSIKDELDHRILSWSYYENFTDTELKRFKKQMWKYRKNLIRNNKIKGRGKMNLL